MVRWCCQKARKRTSVQPVPVSSWGMQASEVRLAFAVADATLTAVNNAPANYTMTATPVNLAFTVSDANLINAGSYVMAAKPISLAFTVTDATLRPAARMRTNPISLGFTVAPANLNNNPKMAAAPIALQFSVGSAILLAGAPPSAYTEGVALAGLYAVVDLATDPPGPTTSLLYTPGVDSWPPYIEERDRLITIDVPEGQTTTLERWTLDGYNIHKTGAGTAYIQDNVWTAPTGDANYMFSVGKYQGSWDSTGGTVTVRRNTIDGSPQAINGAFCDHGQGTVSILDNEMKGFGTYIVVNAGEHNDGRTRALTVQGNWIHEFGMNARNGVAADATKYWNQDTDYNNPALPGGAHLDPFKFGWGCTVNISGNLIDLFDNPGDAGGGFTVSCLSVNGYEGTVSGSITGNVIRWDNGQSWSTNYSPRAPSYAIYLKSTPAGGGLNSLTYNLTVSGNAIQLGTSGAVSRDDYAGATSPSLINGGGNRNYDTGAILSF